LLVGGVFVIGYLALGSLPTTPPQRGSVEEARAMQSAQPGYGRAICRSFADLNQARQAMQAFADAIDSGGDTSGIGIPVMDALSASTSEFGGDYLDDYLGSALSAAHDAIFSATSVAFVVSQDLKPMSARDEAFATMDAALAEIEKRLREVGIACY
jgi:hypothetical protein